MGCPRRAQTAYRVVQERTDQRPALRVGRGRPVLVRGGRAALLVEVVNAAGPARAGSPATARATVCAGCASAWGPGRALEAGPTARRRLAARRAPARGGVDAAAG